jgi:hydrogenase expression/formation protein HypC
MCLAIPARIEEMHGRTGVVALEGSRTEVVLSLVPEAKLGDWVLVHAGHAITVLDPDEARQTYELLREASLVDGE